MINKALSEEQETLILKAILGESKKTESINIEVYKVFVNYVLNSINCLYAKVKELESKIK